MSRVAAPPDLIAQISDPVLRTPPRFWWPAFAAALALCGVFAVSVAKLLHDGVGIWGIDRPVEWAFAIANYIWWIGIGMAGTFISAALHLLRERWRAPLTRYAEAMTVFAVAVSGFFPILHLGRPWFFYWLAPYPNPMTLWPQWKSSLVWDFCAIVAYLIVSILYWYLGLLPDLATLRDRATWRRQQVFYGLLALGWRGDAAHWCHHETLSRWLAVLAVPLVFSVHSMVALDLSQGDVAGWHSAIFPPFFVAGALYSGFAMVMLLGLGLRRWLKLGAVLDDTVFDKLAQALLAVGLFVAYSYAVELFAAFHGRDPGERATATFRLRGPFAWLYWTTLALNVVPLQALWWPRLRRAAPVLIAVAVCIVAGMWCERLMLLVTSLSRGALRSAWGGYAPTFWDWSLFAGSIGVFAALFLLFVRLLPAVAISELRRQRAEPAR
jgi:molybdopterin-containing oxidoreductase family membrane subunit